MSWGSIISAAIPAVASVGSAFLGANAARDAAEAQQAGAARAAGLTEAQMAAYAPWRAAGEQAVNSLAANFGPNFRASPSYAFRRGEGMRAIDAGMAARGLYNSSARDRSAARFADGLASQEYDNWWQRGAQLAGLGQNAVAGQGNMANNLAGIYGQAANAAAAGSIGQANAWGGAFNNIANQNWGGIAKMFGG